MDAVGMASLFHCHRWQLRFYEENDNANAILLTCFTIQQRLADSECLLIIAFVRPLKRRKAAMPLKEHLCHN